MGRLFALCLRQVPSENTLGLDSFDVGYLSRQIFHYGLNLSAITHLSHWRTGQPLDQSVLLADQARLLFQLTGQQLDAALQRCQILLACS